MSGWCLLCFSYTVCARHLDWKLAHCLVVELHKCRWWVYDLNITKSIAKKLWGREGVDVSIKTKRNMFVNFKSSNQFSKNTFDMCGSVQLRGLNLFVSILHSPTFLPWDFGRLRRPVLDSHGCILQKKKVTNSRHFWPPKYLNLQENYLRSLCRRACAEKGIKHTTLPKLRSKDYTGIEIHIQE